MPLVKRRVRTEIPHTFGIINEEQVRFVHPSRPLKETDTVVPLHEIRDRQLQDLAYLSPSEYLQPCLDRGLQPARPRVAGEDETQALDESLPLTRARKSEPSFTPRTAGRAAPKGIKFPPNAAEAALDLEDLDDDEIDLDALDEGDEQGVEASQESGEEEGDEEDRSLRIETEADLDAAQNAFLELSAEDAVKFIQNNASRKAVLSRMHEAEQSRPKARKTVLEALGKAGVA
jgi:hypothetical protein